MTIVLDPTNQHLVTITPGRPLTLPGGEVMQRAYAECSQGDFMASGNSHGVIDAAMTHSDNHSQEG
jgi:hypothetical protein